MYVFPTGSYAPDLSWGYFLSWGVFNSWESITIPLAGLSIMLCTRLWVLPVRKPWILLLVTVGAALWWLGFAAAIKATFLRLVYLADVIRVGWM
jgi:hypothetical protein